MATDKGVRQAQFTPQRAYFILEQFAQRFNQLQVHPLGQPTNIVVGFDHYRRATGERHGLDYIGIQSPLGQERGVADAGRLLFKNFNEQAPDDFSLGFRVIDPFKRIEKPIAGVDMYEWDIEMTAK